MKIIVSLWTILVLAGTAHAHADLQSRGFVCTRNGNFSDLVSLYSHKSIWRFAFSQQCERAREQARTGYMCVPNGKDVALIYRTGEVIDNFTFSTECEHTRRDILNHL